MNGGGAPSPICAPDWVSKNLDTAFKIATALQAGVQSEPDLDPIVLSIQAKLRRAGKGKRLVIENGATIEVNERLVELIKEALRSETSSFQVRTLVSRR